VAAVPTWREQGIDNVFSASQGLIGPRGMTPAQIAFWESAAQRLAQSDEWKKELAASYWETNPLGSRDAVKFYETQFADLREMLADLGFAKQ
jgi:putative tricarboxylic transport membrane protein